MSGILVFVGVMLAWGTVLYHIAVISWEKQNALQALPRKSARAEDEEMR